MTDTPQSKGGKQRAKNLSADERKAIARTAAQSRWAEVANLPKATHIGTLNIGNAEIPCAVLSDGTRLLTQAGFLGALGRSTKPKGKSQQVTDGLPPFLATKSLKPLITQDVIDATVPVHFTTPTGGRAQGFRAELLPRICDLFLEARGLDYLTKQQLPIAVKCELLVRALAKVGIVALVDEATGYQEDRDRDALYKLLEVYLSEERLAWAKRFPDEFFKQIYRLKKWPWPSGRGKTPYVGKLINQIVYERLPEGVLGALQERNPTKPGTGRRKWKHHQFLSEDLGQPDLRDHLLQVVAIMRVSTDWKLFERNLDQAFPEPGTQIELELSSEQ